MPPDISEARDFMLNWPSKAVITRVVVLISALMAILILSAPSHNVTFAQDATISYAENGMDPVATFTAVDPEGEDIVWSLDGADKDGFKIEGGVLTFAKSPDYEAPVDTGGNNTYQVTVRAGDGRPEATTMGMQGVIVTVDNVDEDGTVTLTTLQPVDGNAITATLTDPDGTPTGTPEWQWANSDSADGPFINIEEAAEAGTYTPVPADKTKFLRATVTYTDPQGTDKTAQVVSANAVLAARSANTAPVFEDEQGDEIATSDPLTRQVAENTDAGSARGRPGCGQGQRGRHIDLRSAEWYRCRFLRHRRSDRPVVDEVTVGLRLHNCYTKEIIFRPSEGHGSVHRVQYGR